MDNTISNSSVIHRGRFVALDVIRGIAILGMILVVSPGSWEHKLAFLNHAAWEGYTPADLIFPLFLFAIGAAMSFGFPSDRTAKDETLRVVRRGSLLIMLGLFLNLLPSFNIETLRIPGILQRIALCYVFASLIVFGLAQHSGKQRIISYKHIIISIIALSIAWQLVLNFTSAPGFEMGDVSQGGTLASWVDRQIFGIAHLWPYGTDAQGQVVYDPEGLLATFPATINVLFGVLVANWLGRDAKPNKLFIACGIGLALVVVGHILDTVFVINKRIWTPSFAFVSAGWSITLYALVIFSLTKKATETVLLPLTILGGNAILAFSISQVLSAYAGMQIAGTSPQSFFFELLQSLLGNPLFASFMCSVLVSCAVVILIYPLYKKSIHIRL